ncbi:unnamed protein product [Trichogramma brassicae]|uniref:C2H2-type domain-containing protein n=1 Tax=Trichogramma brassicae TaxID=86971 RepID=A0A6H5IT06_9HYME|nr:unnamed protein product [Trichogramma brassicae]
MDKSQEKSGTETSEENFSEHDIVVSDHNRRFYACDRCEKKFGRKPDLLKHQKTVHEGRKDYLCDKCEKKFTQVGNLHFHQRTVHEGLKNYACDRCEKKFGLKQHLLVHQRTVHEGRKDFTCDKCDRKFGVKFKLIEHQKTVHEGRKDYACDKNKSRLIQISTRKEGSLVRLKHIDLVNGISPTFAARAQRGLLVDGGLCNKYHQ